MAMHQTTARICWNQHLGASYYKIGLECPEGYDKAQPGQFVMVHLRDRVEPLLGRPFSIHRLLGGRAGNNGIELLYKVVGQSTRAMAGLAAGDRIDVLGPLGQGFGMQPAYVRSYIVAGGIGVAPMVFLAQTLKQLKGEQRRAQVFLGGRSKSDLLCRDDFKDLDLDVHLSTDDGSAGTHGLVTELLQKRLAHEKPDVIYACGPMAMLKAVSAIADGNGIPCQVSLETIMACGMGACLGCAVEGRVATERYLHVCLDGPVLDAARLRF